MTEKREDGVEGKEKKEGKEVIMTPSVFTS